MNVAVQPAAWDQTARMWFDEPDAHTQLQRRTDLDADTRGDLRKWIDDGYFVTHGLIEPDLIDAVVKDVADIWTENTPRENLLINRVLMPDDQFLARIRHTELLAFPQAVRDRIRQRSNYTLGDCHHWSPAVAKFYSHPRILNLCSTVLGGQAESRASLYFDKGSEQSIHQDLGVFATYPRNAFIGVWIALQDIDEGCGPLVYYPKSHTEPLWHEFSNYPQTNLRQGILDPNDPGKTDTSVFKRYDAYLAEVSSRYEARHATLKKGSILFWHGMLIHGGSKVTRPGSTRHSLVLHVMKQGCDVTGRMTGPVNW